MTYVTINQIALRWGLTALIVTTHTYLAKDIPAITALAGYLGCFAVSA
jgi:hypothetical protein